MNLDDERLPISVLRSKRFAIREVKLQQTKESKDVILRHDGGIHLDTPYFFLQIQCYDFTDFLCEPPVVDFVSYSLF